MRNVGFTKTQMPEEGRVALLPQDIKRISQPACLFFEHGYARHLGVSDDAYREAGANVVSTDEASSQAVICIPKPWRDDIYKFKDGQTAIGWFYLAEKRDLTKPAIERKMTVIGWQDMYDDDGKYTFERNRWYAGYIAVTQALPFARASQKRSRIGVLGTENGRVARGALARLKEEGLVEGQHYETFGRTSNGSFRRRLPEFDVVINCGYYDPTQDYLIKLTDLQEMEDGALVIDACSEGIEGSEPHPAFAPFFWLGRFNRVLVYNNNHCPTMWALEVSETMSDDFAPHLDDIVNERTNPILERATILRNGDIIDQRIHKLLGT